MPDDAGSARPSPAIYALIALRFLLELALWASFTVSCVRLIDGPLGWVVGLLLTAAVTAVWGLLLSPRRRVQLPVAARVTIELTLFAAASALLAWSGLTVAAITLLVVELIDLALLQGPDKNAI
jgi:uncharacterized membrane protein